MNDVQAYFEQGIDVVLLIGEPLKITRNEGDANLLSEELLNGMTETLPLLSISGM